MPDQTYTYQPPLSWISNSEIRTLGFHAYQIFELLRGSGDPAAMPDYHLDITGSTGSGPLYNITLAYDAAISNGLNNIQIGDKLIVGDDIDNTTGGAKQWYRYDITAISSKSASSASITIKYISDTVSGGDVPPDNLHYDYGAYSASLNLNIIARELNSQFILG